MWKTLSLLFLAANIGWAHKVGDLSLADEAARAEEELMETLKAISSSLMPFTDDYRQFEPMLKMIIHYLLGEFKILILDLKRLSDEQTVANLLNQINNALMSGAAIMTGQHDNWRVLEDYQYVLKKKAYCLDLLRTLAKVQEVQVVQEL